MDFMLSNAAVAFTDVEIIQNLRIFFNFIKKNEMSQSCGAQRCPQTPADEIGNCWVMKHNPTILNRRVAGRLKRCHGDPWPWSLRVEKRWVWKMFNEHSRQACVYRGCGPERRAPPPPPGDYSSVLIKAVAVGNLPSATCLITTWCDDVVIY